MFRFGIIAENVEVLQNVSMWVGFDSGLNALLELNLMVLYSALRVFFHRFSGFPLCEPTVHFNLI